jgi:hypothetical protein
VEAFYNGVAHGMLVPLDMNINCRIRRENSQLRLLPKSMPPEPDSEKYTGGKLFGEVPHEL